MKALTRRLPRRSDDSGFSLVESIVALVIAGIVFSALAGVLISALQSSVYGRQNQQAADFMTRRVEEVRRLDFGAMAHAQADVAGDTRLVSCGSARCLDVEGTLEPVVTGLGTVGVPQHVQLLTDDTTNSTDYTVSTYITAAAGQDVDQVRRVTVVITWMHGDQTRTREISTLVAYTQRGLPLPVFKLEVVEPTVTKNPGAQIVFKLRLANQGAPDRSNLQLSGPGATLLPAWRLVLDVDGDDAYNPAIDTTLLTDTTADGIIDTGRIEPSSTVKFFLVRDSSPSDSLGTVPTVLTATSVGQPTATGGTGSITATTVLVSGPVTPTTPPTPTPTPTITPPADCPALTPVGASKPASGGSQYTLVRYVLHNEPAGDTAHQGQLYLSPAAADENLLPRYSTDLLPTQTGRALQRYSGATTVTGVLTTTTSTQFADFAMQLPERQTYAGTAVLHLWVARADAGTSPVSLRAVLYSGTGSSGTTLSRTAISGLVTVPPDGLTCGGFQEAYIPVPVTGSPSVAKNAWLGVRLVSTGADPLRLAYDVSSAGFRPYPASLTIAEK